MGLPGFAELYHPGKVRMSDIVTIFGRQTENHFNNPGTRHELRILASIDTGHLGTDQAAPTFPIIVTIALPNGTGSTNPAVIQMANGVRATYIRARHLHTGEPTLTFTIIITVSLSGTTGPKITTVI
jgi:hypothetical protein